MDQSLIEFAKFLVNAKNSKIVYFRTVPEIIDFSTKNFTFELKIFYENQEFSIIVNKSNFKIIYCFMKESIFRDKIKILCYNFKSYCSVYKCLTKKDIDIQSDIFDLKVISSILGQKMEEPPPTLKSAYSQFKAILEGNWDKIKRTYREIHLPLITKVIPGIENHGIIDLESKIIKKSYYEIESQENSRLSNFNCLDNCFLPMNLKKEDKQKIIPLSQENFFVYFDYRNMEVSILENLTKDPNLTRILKKYNDFYEGLYREIINNENFDKEKRKKVKSIFLPYIYGASESLISEKCKLSTNVVKEICQRIRETFSETFIWLENFSRSADELGFYKNKFGKKRFIDQKYKSINFIVQSTAAIFCLDKLIDIYNALDGKNINFYIHDGYVFSINKEELDSKIKIIKNILMEENENFQNMIINISCSYGRNLNNMKEYNEENM